MPKTKEEKAFKQRQYYHDHKEERSAYGRQYYLEHKEERSAYHREYHQKHYQKNKREKQEKIAYETPVDTTWLKICQDAKEKNEKMRSFDAVATAKGSAASQD